MKPGIHDGIPEPQYHADPALSQSQLKVLLDCPARFAWARTQPPKTSDAFDIGTAVHAKVLGVGAPTVVVDAADWRTNAAKAARDEARAAGLVPLLRADAARVDAMAEAVLAHEGARVVLETEGAVEQSMWWTREVDGMSVPMRGRVDKATAYADGWPVLVDLKTSASASPRRFASSVWDFGYHIQRAAYVDGWTRLTQSADGIVPDFLIVVVEKDPPHLPAVYQLDDIATQRGEERYAAALSLFVDCTREDHWPGYADDIVTLPSPRWAS